MLKIHMLFLAIFLVLGIYQDIVSSTVNDCVIRAGLKRTTMQHSKEKSHLICSSGCTFFHSIMILTDKARK